MRIGSHRQACFISRQVTLSHGDPRPQNPMHTAEDQDSATKSTFEIDGARLAEHETGQRRASGEATKGTARQSQVTRGRRAHKVVPAINTVERGLKVGINHE
jgi:hypothetical protein